MSSDPPGDLLDGRSFELSVSRAILEGGVQSRRKKRSGLEVAGLGGEKRRLGETDDLAEAEFGVVKLTADKVGARVCRMGAIGRGVGDNGVGERVLKKEERIREEIHGVCDASSACLGDEDVMAAIVGESGHLKKMLGTCMTFS
jgi:hypothetical protein